jgi:microcystin-dependent protein
MQKNIKSAASSVLLGVGALMSTYLPVAYAEVEPMLGEITLYAFNFAPRGWALANGQFLPINQNQALFSLLGTAYGGNGTTTFALPDLRNRTPIGTGDTTLLGQPLGADTATLTQIPGMAGTSLTLETRGVETTPRASGSVAVQHVSKAAVAGGSGTPIYIRPPSLTLNYSITLQGLFGTRGCILGEIITYAGTYLSGSNLLPADGRLLNISQNTALFSILGTTYGGNGTSTFALPNLNNRLPVGAGMGPGLTSVSLGESGGSSTVTLTRDQMPNTSMGYNITTKGVGVNTASRVTSPPIDVIAAASATSAGSVSLPIQPPSLGVSYYICAFGVFPQRP